MNKIFERVIEIVGWLQIVLSPTLIGIGIGLAICFNYQNLLGIIVGILFAISGLIIGIIWATKVYKTTGTMSFLSRLSETPDIIENNKIENLKSKNRKSNRN